MKGLASGLFTLLVVGHLGGRPAAQVQTPASGLVAGSLVAADSGQPVRKATVTLTSTTTRSRLTAESDGDGRFVFDAVPPGEYTLLATRTGYVPMVFGARAPGASQGGTPVRVQSGARVENLRMSMPRAGVIAGTVTDEYGDSAYNVPVRALRYAYDNGHRVVRAAGSATTNDLGEYRIANLEPGEYLVTAVPRDTVAAAAARAESIRRMQAETAAAAAAGDREARAAVATLAQARREGRMSAPPEPVGYVPTYYPRAVLPSLASVVPVSLGGLVVGIDLRLDVARTGSVSGTIMNTDGRPMQGNLKLIHPALPVTPIGAWFTSSTPDGRFAFHGVVPGNYVLGGNNSPPGTIGGPPTAGGVFQMSGPVPVTVTDSGATQAEVRMEPVSAISGRVNFDSITAPFRREEFRLNFLPVTTPADWEMAIYRVVPAADGSFVIENVVAARYRVGVSGAPEGWVVDSAMVNGRETADTHLVVEPGRLYENAAISLTDQTSAVTGTVTNSRAEPVDQLTVILFPERPEFRVPQSRRIRVGRTGPDGRFAFRGLPAGNYRIAAVVDHEAGREFEAEFLDTLAQASVSLVLGAGETKTHDLRVR